MGWKPVEPIVFWFLQSFFFIYKEGFCIGFIDTRHLIPLQQTVSDRAVWYDLPNAIVKTIKKKINTEEAALNPILKFNIDAGGLKCAAVAGDSRPAQLPNIDLILVSVFHQTLDKDAEHCRPHDTTASRI